VEFFQRNRKRLIEKSKSFLPPAGIRGLKQHEKGLFDDGYSAGVYSVSRPLFQPGSRGFSRERSGRQGGIITDRGKNGQRRWAEPPAAVRRGWTDTRREKLAESVPCPSAAATLKGSNSSARRETPGTRAGGKNILFGGTPHPGALPWAIRRAPFQGAARHRQYAGPPSAPCAFPFRACLAHHRRASPGTPQPQLATTV